jgi:histidine triad (HIT) family protein
VNADPNCIFCKIVAGEIPAKILLEEDDLLVFHDIQGQAPTHLLVIPKRHIATLNDVAQPSDADAMLLGRLLSACARAAALVGVEDYRVVNNCGEAVGQSVFHIHLHLLGGREFSWPPG